jgi:hypothetical protein
VTFLCPSNWKSIEKDIESGDYVNGVNTLKAHVLQGFYPDLDGLMEQKDGLVNSLGQVVEVKSKSGSTVLLKDGGKVTEVKPKFQGTPDRSNIMVFTYDGSLLPTNAPAGSLKYTSAPSGKQSKSGGGFRGMNKLSLTKGVEQRALNLIRQQSASGDSDSKLYMSHNPYAAALVSLYTYANMAAPDKVNELYSLLDVFPEQAFYATINPYGQSSLDCASDRAEGAIVEVDADRRVRRCADDNVRVDEIEAECACGRGERECLLGLVVEVEFERSFHFEAGVVEVGRCVCAEDVVVDEVRFEVDRRRFEDGR